ncbi:MAG: ABC transporter substrate-binding protein [Candidatus Hodarchaeales archaeon]|jgi:ABC-type transport system substrate-binding protein
MRNWNALVLVTQLVFIVVFPAPWQYRKNQTDELNHLIASSLDPPNSIRILDMGSSPWFHPFYDRSSELSLIYDTLVDFDPDTGEPIPALARQWVVTNDSKHWTFYLREDVYFHDGSEFDAFAVEQLFDLLLNTPDPGVVYYSLPIDSVEVLSKYIIRINLNKPYSNFICRIPFIPAPGHYEIESEEKLPIGTGPYRLDTITEEPNLQEYTFIRNQKHFRGIPPFETIQKVIYANYTEFEAAIKDHQGEITMSNVNPSVLNDSYWQLSPKGGLIELCWLNHAQKELANQKVRLALNYAIDKRAYTEIEKNGTDIKSYLQSQIISESQPAYSIMPTNSKYNRQFIKLNVNESNLGYPYNPQLAEELLDEAGYLRGDDGYRFDLVITAPEWRTDRAQFLSFYFDAIGIRCNISISESYQAWYQDLFEGNFDLFDAGLNDWFSFYDLLHSSGELNSGSFSHDLMDLYTFLDQQTPVSQEEYAPYILLLDAQINYLKATTIAPFVRLASTASNARYDFNYTTDQSPKVKFSVKEQFSSSDQEITTRTMENIEFKNQSIYFPFTDAIITSKQKIRVTIRQSNNLKSFKPEINLPGEFFWVDIDNQQADYYLRCYYNLEEITSEVVDNKTWVEGQIVSANSDLRYIEIKTKGNILVYVTKSEKGNITVWVQTLLPPMTFRYIPSILMISLIMVAFLGIILIKNQKQANKMRKLFE